MLWAGSKRHDVYVGTRAAIVCDGDGRVRLAEITKSLSNSLESIGKELKRQPRRKALNIWLSGGLCRPFLLPTIEGLREGNELERVARSLVSGRTGLSPASEIRFDSSAKDGNVLAVATERETLAQVTAALGTVGSIRSVQPWWAEVLRAALVRDRPPGLLGVQDCDSLTLLSGADSTFQSVGTTSPLDGLAGLDSVWLRAQMSVDAGVECILGRLRLESEHPAEPCALGAVLTLSA